MMSRIRRVIRLRTVMATGAVLWVVSLPGTPRFLSLSALLAGILVGTMIRTDSGVLASGVRRSRRAANPAERPSRALIVGAGTIGQSLASRLEAGGRYQVVGFIDDHLSNGTSETWPVLGERARIKAIIHQHSIDELFLTYAPTWQQLLIEDLATDQPNVAVHVVPSTYEAVISARCLDHLGDIALVRLMAETGRAWAITKRFLDIGMAVGGLLLAGPLLVAIALLVRMSSPGPVIFAQERVGRSGKPFILYKFRTMVHNAELATGPILSCGMDDGRLTSLGRWLRLFCIDEIPQLWNVLRGEMSLVGPRPERPCFVETFQRTIPMYALRHEVRPGLTGLAQVCGGYRTHPRDKLRFDLIYVSHQSLWLDLSILLRTVLVVCCARGH